MNFRHCFGIHGPVRDNVLVFKSGQQSNELLIFPVGRSVAVYDTNKKTMDFFKESRKDSQEVCALALSDSHKFLAICDRDDKTAETQVSIFSTSSRKQLRKMSASKESIILSVCFSRDSKLLVTSSKEMITIWSWEKEKIELSLNISDTINRVRCPTVPFMNNPINDHVFSTSGPRHLKLWTLTSNKHLSQCMVMPSQFKEKQYNFTDHIWLKVDKNEKHQLAVCADYMVGSSMQNRKISVMIFQVSEKSTNKSFHVENIHNVDVLCKMSTSVETICGYKNGFILAGNCGFLSFYQKNLMKGQEKSNFVHISSFTCEEKDNFTSLCVKEEEDQVIIFDNRKRLLSIPVEELKGADDDADIIEKFEECLPVHIGVILDMDVSLQNSILATCAQDRSIRIWNYNTFQCELVHKFFNDEPTTVSINPNGYQILVGLKNRFVGYHLLLNEILPHMEVVCIDCQKVRFSSGGHIFAVCAGSNILIYSTYNDKSLPVKPIHVFHGHTAPLNALIWNCNDTMLYSTGKDGKVYGWNLITKAKFGELNAILQSTNYISIVKSEKCPDNLNKMAVCNADGFLFELEWVEGDDIKCRQISLPSSPSDRVTALCLSADENYLFAGTAGGFIRLYEWPFHPQTPDFKKYAAHNCGFSKVKGNPYGLRGVTCLKVIKNMLISVGVDGSIFVFNDGALDSKSEIMKTEVVFIRAVEYYDAKEEIVDVCRQLDEIKKEHEFVVDSKDMHWQSKVDELSEKSTQLVGNERARYEKLRNAHDDAIQNHAKTLEDIKSKHNLEIEVMKNEHEHVLNLQKETLEETRKEMELQKESYELMLRTQKDKHDKELQVLELKKDQIEGSLTAAINRLKDESKLSEKMFKEILDQQEEEYEMELVQLNLAREKEINHEEDKTKKIQGFVRNINTKRNEQDKRYQELKIKLESQEILLLEEKKIKADLQNELEKMNVLLKKSEEEIKNKVDVINDLKLESSRLDTHRYVLTDQLQDVKDQTAPLQKRIEEYEREVSLLKGKLAEQVTIIKKNSDEIKEKQIKINIHKKRKQYLSKKVA